MPRAGHVEDGRGDGERTGGAEPDVGEQHAAARPRLEARGLVERVVRAVRVEVVELALRAGAPSAVALTADVSVAGDVARAVDEAIAALGRVDILCSNAGVLDDYRDALACTEEQWDRVFGVNLKATWLMSRAVLPGMLERESGCIIVTASVAGMVAGGGGVAYTASKHGVIGLMRQLAYDHAAKGVKVNAICPGVVQTGMTLLFGSLALAALYIFARLNSRFDPLDPRFGSCIPPINSRPRDP